MTTFEQQNFMRAAIAQAERATCLAKPVGAVIVRSKQIVSAGWNSPPFELEGCDERGHCYAGLAVCSDNNLPSRAIHAEAMAIGNAARWGRSTLRADLFVTLQPCLHCLKLAVAAGIGNIYYLEAHGSPESNAVRDMFLSNGVIKMHQITLGGDL